MGRALSGRRRQAAALLAVVVVALSAPSPATAVGPGPVSSGLRSAGSEATGATREDGTIKGPGAAPAEAGASIIVASPLPAKVLRIGPSVTDSLKKRTSTWTVSLASPHTSRRPSVSR